MKICDNCGSKSISKKEVLKGENIKINGLIHRLEIYASSYSSKSFTALKDCVLYKCDVCDIRVAGDAKPKVEMAQQVSLF